MAFLRRPPMSAHRQISGERRTSAVRDNGLVQLRVLLQPAPSSAASADACINATETLFAGAGNRIGTFETNGGAAGSPLVVLNPDIPRISSKGRL
jgi:hypothetical protein